MGRQQKAVQQVEQKFIREGVWPTLEDPECAVMRSQHGPLTSLPLTGVPCSRMTRTQGFHFLLSHRLWFPCRCGRQMVSHGHLGAVCPVQRFSDGLEGSRKFSNVLFLHTLCGSQYLLQVQHDSQRLFLLGVERQDGRNTDPSSSGNKTKQHHDN